MKRVYAFCFDHRNRLAALPLLYALASTRWEWERDWITWPLATLVCGLGVGLRAWAICHCSFGQGRKKELATTGPYAFVRNPLYIGNLAVLAGLIVASELAWLLPLALLWALLVYSAAIRHEERRLEENYGEEYRAYRSSTPAWIPRQPIASSPLLVAALRQSWALVLLLPFALKELNVLDLWHD